MSEVTFKMTKVVFKKKKRVMSKEERIVMIIMLVLFIMYSLSLIYPMIWMAMSSLKGSLEYEAGNAFALPQKWLFKNYLDAFTKLEIKKAGFFKMVWNSIWMSGLSIFIGAIGSAMICYVMAKLRFPGRTIIYTIIILQMIIPTYGSFPAVYKMKRDLGLYDNIWNIVVSSIGVGGYRFLILYAFYKGVSWSYAEAGFMDGASQFQVFWHIMFPMVIGPIATFAMMDFIGAWNDYMWPSIIMNSMAKLTVTPGMEKVKASFNTQPGHAIAGGFIAVIPTFIVYLFAQKYFMKGMQMQGGVKG